MIVVVVVGACGFRSVCWAHETGNYLGEQYIIVPRLLLLVVMVVVVVVVVVLLCCCSCYCFGHG